MELDHSRGAYISEPFHVVPRLFALPPQASPWGWVALCGAGRGVKDAFREAKSQIKHKEPCTSCGLNSQSAAEVPGPTLSF
jgi:hypothetical protein